MILIFKRGDKEVKVVEGPAANVLIGAIMSVDPFKMKQRFVFEDSPKLIVTQEDGEIMKKAIWNFTQPIPSLTILL